MDPVKLTATVVVVPDQQYTLTIKIGDGQKGASSFKNFKNEYIYGEQITNSPLGSGEEVKGRKLFISSMVTDVNPHTNSVSIYFYINDQKVTEKETAADANNGSVFFETSLTFI